MKKFKSKKMLGSFFALLAGAMLTFVGCDSGNGEYQDEIPTTWEDLGATVVDTDVTAVWSFATAPAGMDTSEKSLEGVTIAPVSGTGATLVGCNSYGAKHGGEKAYIQASNKTASLNEPEKGAALKLTLSKPSNFVVYADGAGAATSARLIMITNAAGEPIVYKDNLGNTATKADTGTVAFEVNGAPAGSYIIYWNGSRIWEIDTTGPKTTEPSFLDADEFDFEIDSTDFEVYDEIKCTGDGYAKKDDLQWWSTDTSVATVNKGTITGTGVGSAKICARSGRTVVAKDVTVKPSTKTLIKFFDGSKMPAAAVRAPYVKDDVDTTATAKTTYAPTMLKSGEDYEKFTQALDKCLEPVHIGNFATATKATISDFGIPTYNLVVENAAISDNGLPSLMPKFSDSNSTAMKFGLSWKDGYGTATENDNIVTLTTKIKPNGTVKIAGVRAIMANGKTSKTHVKVVVDGAELGSCVSTKTPTGPSIATFDTPKEISGETEVSIVIYQEFTNGSSNSIQDIALVITK